MHGQDLEKDGNHLGAMILWSVLEAEGIVKRDGLLYSRELAEALIKLMQGSDDRVAELMEVWSLYTN